VEVREAIERTHVDPRPVEVDESLYPKTGWLGAYLAYARESNAPISFHFWMGATVLGAAMRRNVYLPIGYTLWPNLYLFLIGDSGVGKTTAKDHADPVIRRANDLLVQEMLTYAHPFGAPPPPDRRVKILEPDVSPEWLIKTLQAGVYPLPQSDHPDAPTQLASEDSVALLYNDELVTLAAKHKYASTGIFHLLTALYTCPDEYGRGTIARQQEVIKKPALTVMFGSTLEWINKSISEEMFTGGFMSRCIFCYRTQLGFPAFARQPARDPVLRHVLARLLVPWMLLNPPRPVVMTEGARELWAKTFARCREQMADPEEPRMKPYFERKLNHIGKLALILLASELVGDPDAFTIETLEARPSFSLSESLLREAIAIVEHEEQYLPECFAKIGEHRDAQKVEQLLSTVQRLFAESGPVPRALLTAKARSLFGLEAPKVIEQMVASGLLYTVREKALNAPGPRKTYYVPTVQ
jgi:hypothetical protein